MKFGLSYHTAFAGTNPANLKAIAGHADDLGFESFYVPEHVTLYPGARVGEAEFAPDLTDGTTPAALKLIGTKITSRGVVAHIYQPSGKPEYGSAAAGQQGDVVTDSVSRQAAR